MAAQAGRGRPAARKTAPKKAELPITSTEVITEENAPEVPEGPAAPVVEKSVDAPVEVVEETPQQREIRELKEQVAALLAMASQPTTTATQVVEEVKDGDKILIHFIEDGHTAQGQVWYRGQELEFTVGSKAWEDTLDRNGDSWVLLSEDVQSDKWGVAKYRRGPWPGKKTYTAGEWEKEAPPESALTEADNKERERRLRGAPTLPDPSKI